MKRILLSLTALCAAVSLNAQTFVNAGFEDAMTAVPGFVNVHQTSGWGVIINGGPESTDVSEGAQAVKLETATDAALNTALTWGSDDITGIALQTYEGAFTNAAATEISFDYKSTIPATDSAFVQVVIIDTMAAGTADDVTLFFANTVINSTVANWTTVTLSMNNAGGTGTANYMEFVAVSSFNGYYNAGSPTIGTTLWLDNLMIDAPASIEENEVSALVYPNPASDVLNIELSEVASNVTIVSLDGKVVVNEAVNSNNVTVDVANLVPGAYVYAIETANGTVRNTFVKK